MGYKVRKRQFLLPLAVVVILSLGLGLYWASQARGRHEDRAIPPVPVPKFIAHAGGGIGNLSYTNSRDALDTNYRHGHRFFELDLDWTKDDKLVLINPQIVHIEGRQDGEEGCLSIPGFREQVRRAKRVTVRARNARGEEFEKTGEDVLARAFLHETDHLNGRLYITHISALKRDLMKRKIKKLQRSGEWG